MTELGSLFLRHATGALADSECARTRSEAAARALEADEFTSACDRCGRVTIWRLVANVIGRQVFKCTGCGLPMLGGSK